MLNDVNPNIVQRALKLTQCNQCGNSSPVIQQTMFFGNDNLYHCKFDEHQMSTPNKSPNVAKRTSFLQGQLDLSNASAHSTTSFIQSVE